MTLTRSHRHFGEHRPDIEGLRAVAIIAVLLFHLEIAPFSGGFVGVDVFFVISGFLIGGIVVREVRYGAFRFGEYLVRRVRRIVPVMLLVLATVTIAACAFLMPSELVDYAWSLGFSSLLLGNAHFWLHRGAYAESEHEVLLHMWTLGVEAQFYVLLPLIVLALMRFGRNAVWFGLVWSGRVGRALCCVIDRVSFTEFLHAASADVGICSGRNDRDYAAAVSERSLGAGRADTPWDRSNPLCCGVF